MPTVELIKASAFDAKIAEIDAVTADRVEQTSADRAAAGVSAGNAAASAIAAGAARDAAETAQGGAEDAAEAAVTAQGLAQTAAANAQASALTCAAWAVLSSLTGSMAGQGAEVLDSDTGTHTDPVVGGTVDNAGRYSWSTSPAGWRRIGATGLAGKAPLVHAHSTGDVEELPGWMDLIETLIAGLNSGKVSAEALGPETGWVYALRDELKKIPFGIRPDGSAFLRLANDAIVPGAALERTLPLESGWLYALMAGTTVLNGVKRDGSMWAKLASDAIVPPEALAKTLPLESGWLYALLTDDLSRVLAGIKRDGTFRAVLSPDSIVPAAAVQGAEVAAPTIWGYGDSLTQGAGGGGTTWPIVLAGLTGLTIHNHGIGGQTSKQIAMRLGALVPRITVSGNQIVSGANSITVIDGVTLASSGGMAADADHPFPLSTASDNGTRTATVTVQGVTGTLTRTASGGPASTAEVYTFTPAAGQILPVTCPPQSPMRFAPDISAGDIVVLWLGRNDNAEPAQIISNLRLGAAAVRARGAHPVVLTVINGNYGAEKVGGASYQRFLDLAADTEAEWPVEAVDIRRILISQGLDRAGISPTAQDTTDIGVDTMPDSLRSDNIHLNADGYSVVAEVIHEHLISRGLVPAA